MVNERCCYIKTTKYTVVYCVKLVSHSVRKDRCTYWFEVFPNINRNDLCTEGKSCSAQNEVEKDKNHVSMDIERFLAWFMAYTLAFYYWNQYLLTQFSTRSDITLQNKHQVRMARAGTRDKNRLEERTRRDEIERERGKWGIG